MLNKLWNAFLASDPKIIAALGVCVSVLVTLAICERPMGVAAREEALYRKIGIDGIAELAAIKRDIHTVYTGDLLKLRQGDLVKISGITRNVSGMVTNVRGHDQRGVTRFIDVADEHSLYCISHIIRQGDPRYVLLAAAHKEGVMP